jgi:hypothetical protein
MSYAFIKYGRIVIPNGMITLEHYTGGINMNRVRVRETNSVDTSERNPCLIKLHSRAQKKTTTRHIASSVKDRPRKPHTHIYIYTALISKSSHF